MSIENDDSATSVEHNLHNFLVYQSYFHAPQCTGTANRISIVPARSYRFTAVQSRLKITKSDTEMLSTRQRRNLAIRSYVICFSPVRISGSILQISCTDRNAFTLMETGLYHFNGVATVSTFSILMILLS
jgi:hypothetical protein